VARIFPKASATNIDRWGENDGIFTVEGARLYTRDLKNAEFHLLDTGHFALEEDLEEMASLIRDFLGRTSAAK
jgi:pimeloyl-ACP methyl ester carboxylesterase